MIGWQDSSSNRLLTIPTYLAKCSKVNPSLNSPFSSPSDRTLLAKSTLRGSKHIVDS